MAQTTNIDRRFFGRYVSRKLKHIYSLSHVEGVISILFEEIVQDLQNDVTIIIGNFGEFILKKLAPRKHQDIKTGELVLSPGYKTIRFQINNKLRRFLIENLDIDKTFKDDYNE